MASGTADLQRDLGGALMQSIFGALLAAGYSAAMTSAIGSSGESAQVTASTQAQLTKSFNGAAATAEQFPKYATQITDAAKASFLKGDQWAYLAGLIAVAIGAVLVLLRYPKKSAEDELFARYHAEDAASPATVGP
jgi:hypothetical protein